MTKDETKTIITIRSPLPVEEFPWNASILLGSECTLPE